MTASTTTIRPVTCKGDLVEVVESVLETTDLEVVNAGVTTASAFLVKQAALGRRQEVVSSVARVLARKGQAGLDLAMKAADHLDITSEAASIWGEIWMESFTTLAAAGR